jgi:hypothetical protein
MAQVDITGSAFRVLNELLARHDEQTGVAGITQREIAAVTAMSLPSVNRGIQSLREAGLAWPSEGTTGQYQLNPVLTGGASPSPVMAIPVIQADPDEVSARRRSKYAAQTATLGHSA